jgi:hypothetical protein
MNAPIFRLTMMILAVWGFAGCAVYQPVQLEPARKTSPIAPRFSEATYYYDQDQNLYFVLRSHTIDQPTGKPVDQIATIRVFWRPRGGVTTLNSSALNATFRYIIMTPDAVGMYEGAGFVRLLSNAGVSRMKARITDGELRLTESSDKFADNLGRAHIHGYFTANFDDVRTLDGLLNAQREFFARSLKSAPKTQPATAPAVTQAGAPAATTQGVVPSP